MRLLQVLVLSAVLSVVLLPSIVGRHDSTRAAAKAVAAAQVDVQATAPAEPVGLVMVGEGCGWWSNGGGQTQTENSATQIAMCVFEQLLQGVTQPAPIGQACGNITLSQVLAALDSILAYYNQPAEGGAGMVCGTGTPPVQGAATCLSTDVLTRATSVRTATAAKMAEAQKH